MYDTINFWIESGDISGGDSSGILPFLSEVVEHRGDMGCRYTGKYKNYVVSTYENGVSLKGSLHTRCNSEEYYFLLQRMMLSVRPKHRQFFGVFQWLGCRLSCVKG